MSYQSKPASKGTYRIKVLRSNLYVESGGHDVSLTLSSLSPSSKRQKWNITPEGNGDRYTITSAEDGYNVDALLFESPRSSHGPLNVLCYGYPTLSKKKFSWVIKEQCRDGVAYSKIALDGSKVSRDGVVWDGTPGGAGGRHSINLVGNINTRILDAGQCFVFESAKDEADSDSQKSKTFENTFFTLTVDEAKSYTYDIIVVGTGIGGGVLAGDLFDGNSQLGINAKRVLVIEKGNLVFHSHCLNTSRPSGLGEDRGQQNDTFFAKFRNDYILSSNTNKSDWTGGPMYCLGGRSAAWGLFLPRVHDDYLAEEFHPEVHNDLIGAYYNEAEKLMNLSLPSTKTIHQDLMERLNIKNDPEVQWQWGRIASEFRDDRNFDFAKGAYSSIDKLLEIAMSKPTEVDAKFLEHNNFKILLGAEVRSLIWNSSKMVTGVRVRSSDKKEHAIYLNHGGSVALCAGSVQSAAILLRSKVDLAGNGGLHLTDHDIFFQASPYMYKNRETRGVVGAMKLQTYTKINNSSTKKTEIVLANMSVDASSFLPRGYSTYNDFPKWIIAFIRPANLNEKNMITLDKNEEPEVTINREKPFNAQDPDLKPLIRLTEEAKKTLKSVLDLEFIENPKPDQSDYFKPLQLGGVAHELGTIPMRGKVPTSGSEAPYCVDENLKLRGYSGVYVCDLSVFPTSPEVNPTLTLAALSLRLSRKTLMPRPIIFRSDEVPRPLDKDTVYVVNSSGKPIKVFVANRAEVSARESNNVILTPGGYGSWRRCNGTTESVYVFRLAYNSWTEYLNDPELFPALPGEITSIL